MLGMASTRPHGITEDVAEMHTDKLGRLTKYIFAKYLWEEIEQILKKNCRGCHTDLPGHICIDQRPSDPQYAQHAQPDKNPYLLYFYATALGSIDVSLIETIYHRSRRLLKMRSGKRDFKQHMKRCFQIWFHNDFATLNEDLTVDSAMSDAVTLARAELTDM